MTYCYLKNKFTKISEDLRLYKGYYLQQSYAYPQAKPQRLNTLTQSPDMTPREYLGDHYEKQLRSP